MMLAPSEVDYMNDVKETQRPPTARELRKAGVPLKLIAQAQLATFFPPRNPGRTVIGPTTKSPERLAAAEAKRARKAAKRLGSAT